MSISIEEQQNMMAMLRSMFSEKFNDHVIQKALRLNTLIIYIWFV